MSKMIVSLYKTNIFGHSATEVLPLVTKDIINPTLLVSGEIVLIWDDGIIFRVANDIHDNNIHKHTWDF